jgi:hypothetical protein
MSEATESSLSQRLRTAPAWQFNLYAIFAAFTTYFCMYAFRKPFAAASYDGAKFFGTEIDAKTAFVIAQIIGYTISKFAGMKICSETGRAGRGALLVKLIAAAWASLVLFAVLPQDLKVIAIFANGLPLGMVWGTVVLYLEGRRTSELLLAGLSCSYIVASGVVKDVGRALMSNFGVPEYWMPAATGGLFFLPFLLAVYLLTNLPGPTEADIKERSARSEMYADDRWAFCKQFSLGLVLLSGMYFFLTAYRDYRDNYGVELLTELGLADIDGVFSMTEIPVAFGVVSVLALLSLVRSNRLGLKIAFGVMIGGQLLMGLAMWMMNAGYIDGVLWYGLIGLGAYLAYVPFGCVLFDRLLAYTRFAGTAVFAIYLTDAIGYTGSVALQLFRDLIFSDTSRLEFFTNLTYAMSFGGAAALIAAMFYFLKQEPGQTSDLSGR